MSQKLVLVTGATGYVGGRLIPRLLQSGFHIRALGRSHAKLKSRPWAQHPGLDVVECDVSDLSSLTKATYGCSAAFYLIRCLEAKEEALAQKAAQNMAKAAADADLERIIYLGCLNTTDEIVHVLQAGPVPVTVLRASMIIGSGSTAFEILRHLADRQPLIFAPAWLRTAVQPIAIRNVLWYLERCLESDEVLGQTFDIGGPDILSSLDMIDIYTQEAGLPKRMFFPLPLPGSTLGSYWIHLVTPVSGSTVKALRAGMTAHATCKENRIVSLIPQKLFTCRQAIRLALQRAQERLIETCWSDAGALRPPEWVHCGDAEYAGGTILECGYRIHIQAPLEEVWKPIIGIGGQTGWYFGSLLWSLRGWVDRLAGGAGLSRGRRHPAQLYVGDALDFWRVLDVEPCRRLALLAEMKLPGEAVLEFTLKPLPDGRTELRQLSKFLPKGLLGIIYWYSLYPLHVWLFRGLLRSIAKAVGKPITSGPHRFCSKLQQECSISAEAD